VLSTALRNWNLRAKAELVDYLVKVGIDLGAGALLLEKFG